MINVSSIITRLKSRGKSLRLPPRLLFIVVGLLTTAWFLVRVIPKPQRATYPCMRATAPLMSAFVLYLLGLVGSVGFLRGARMHAGASRYGQASVLLAAALIVGVMTLPRDERPVFANSTSILGPNQPVGIARGIYPGRVVWIWDSSATNAGCTNVYGDGWFLPRNTSMTMVGTMAAELVQRVTGKPSVAAAWEALFQSYNTTHGRGGTGYTAGETIFIKVNFVSASASTINDDYSIKNTSRYGMAETSPQTVLAVLRQLVNECGIPQDRIAVGDPLKHIYKHVYDLWHAEFPNITYIDYRGAYGRTKPVPASTPSIYYSDRGTILRDGTMPVTSDYLPTVLVNATYLINIGAVKGHARGGVTVCAKNHFGSQTRSAASHLHQGLVSPDKIPARTGYGLYRVQVDLMAHKDLGEKTVLFIADGLWAGSEANDPPRKFTMPPFNGDWCSSLFASQDGVAIESVCYDFLKAEFTQSNPYGSYPQIYGVDDYLLQAADSAYWPANFSYDPENDRTSFGSLGVCEHWNNPADKQYTRNLGTGNGIELVTVRGTPTGVRQAGAEIPASFRIDHSYPNPFNGTTTITYELGTAARVTAAVVDALGRHVAALRDEDQAAGVHLLRWDARGDGGSPLPSGIYFCRVSIGSETRTVKLIYMK